MAKFHGKIGFAETVETTPGVWKEQIIERTYSGDWLEENRRLQGTDSVNDTVNISNELTILADPFAYNSFHSIRYVEYLGTKWKVSTVKVRRPRLMLNLGGEYIG